MLNNKRGFELAISALVLIILGIFVLAGLTAALVFNWEKFSSTVKGYFGSDEQKAIDSCELQCSLFQKHDFCCLEKQIGKNKANCTGLNVDCSNFNCEEVVC